MSVRSVRPPFGLGVVLAGLLGLALSLTPTAAAASSSSTCDSTFRVQHDDRIGSLTLPEGNYQVRVDGVSCSSAFGLLPAFLADYDGRLPGGWRVTNRGRGEGLFRRGRTAIAVSYRKNGQSDSPPINLDCPKRFNVLEPTLAGEVMLPRGSYRITRLSRVAPSCDQAARLLKGFLGNADEVLPGGWLSFRDDGTFIRDSSTFGFRVDPY